MSAASARLEFRVSPESKSRIERAAELAGEQPTAFARAAAEDRAERILREHASTTTVPATYFDDLVAALDAPGEASPALADAFTRMRDHVRRD